MYHSYSIDILVFAETDDDSDQKQELCQVTDSSEEIQAEQPVQKPHLPLNSRLLWPPLPMSQDVVWYPPLMLPEYLSHHIARNQPHAMEMLHIMSRRHIMNR